jgi:hypothetical protein
MIIRAYKYCDAFLTSLPPDTSLSLGMTRRRSSKGKWEEKIED